MKSLVLALALIATSTASASPGQAQIDRRAQAIVLMNSERLMTSEGKSLSTVLAEATSGENTHNFISNSCSYDRHDQQFKCTLTVLNRDNDGSTESATRIKYQLERGSNGLPSADLFYYSIEVEIAG